LVFKANWRPTEAASNEPIFCVNATNTVSFGFWTQHASFHTWFWFLGFQGGTGTSEAITGQF
jgi:hypothetical protein